jgi:DNA repair exonuclease SbcCD ATPase subunit
MHPKKGYEFIFDQIKGSNDANAATNNEELRKRQQRRDNRGKLFRTLGDGIAAMSNLYFATKGAPSVTYDPKGSLSARAVERWDKMEALRREEEQKQYVREKNARDEEWRRQRAKITDEQYAQKEAAAERRHQATMADREKSREQEAKQWEEKLTHEKEMQKSKEEASYREEQYRQNSKKDDDNADSLAEWFYSLPQETKDYYTRKYGKALTPKQMQQARGEEKAKGKQKAKVEEKASSVTAYPYYKPVEETIAKVNNAAETAKKNSSAENKPKGFSWVNKNNMTKVNW